MPSTRSWICVFRHRGFSMAVLTISLAFAAFAVNVHAAVLQSFILHGHAGGSGHGLDGLVRAFVAPARPGWRPAGPAPADLWRRVLDGVITFGARSPRTWG